MARHPAFEHLDHLHILEQPQLRKRMMRVWRREVRRVAQKYPQLSSSRRRRIALDNLTSKLAKVVHRFSTPLSETLGALDSLLPLADGHSGHDVAAPDKKAVAQAKDWIERMYYEVLYSPKKWRRPQVTASRDGDVAFEWWNGDKRLAVYVSAKGETRYVKYWGSDVNAQMQEGDADSYAIRKELWSWLLA